MPRIRRTRHSESGILHRLQEISPEFHIPANEAEALNAASALGYVMEGPPCNIFTQQYDGTVPFYRLFNLGIVDHFYTTNAAERDNAVANLQYNYEGIAGYVYPSAEYYGVVPLLRAKRAIFG